MQQIINFQEEQSVSLCEYSVMTAMARCFCHELESLDVLEKIVLSFVLF